VIDENTLASHPVTASLDFLLSATFGSTFKILVDQNYLPLLYSLIINKSNK
jgi:hypothetical protein